MDVEYEQALRMSPFVKRMVDIRRKLHPLEKIPTFTLDKNPFIKPSTMKQMMNLLSKNRQELRDHVKTIEVNHLLQIFELSRILNNMMIFYTLYQNLRVEKHISSMFFEPCVKPRTVKHIHDVYAFEQWKAQISEAVAEEFCNFIRNNPTSFRIETYNTPHTKSPRSRDGYDFIWHIKEFVFFGTLKDCRFPAILPNVVLFDVSNTSMTDIPQLPLCERVICSHNNIYTLPDLPQCIELDCSHNMILRLPQIPKCIVLNCSHNLLRHLPEMPCARIIECDYNNLVDIKGMPSCDVLWCSFNSLLAFPSVPSVTDLDCSHNNIHNANESDVFERCTYLDCSYNPSLNQLPHVPTIFQCYYTHTKIVSDIPEIKTMS